MSYQAIKEYYVRVNAALLNKQLDLAKEILYEQMPTALYDMSLDILYNYNQVFVDEELRTLILNVDKHLNGNSNEEDYIDTGISDTSELF